MDEPELLIRMLEAIGRHAQACADELRALRTQAGDVGATRGEGHARSGGSDGNGE